MEDLGWFNLPILLIAILLIPSASVIALVIQVVRSVRNRMSKRRRSSMAQPPRLTGPNSVGALREKNILEAAAIERW